MNDFKDMVRDYCDGSLGEEDLRLLEEELKTSAESRQYLIEYLNVDAGLKELVEGDSEIREFPTEVNPPRKNYWAYAAVALLAFNLIIFSSTSPRESLLVDKEVVEDVSLVPPLNSVAKLTRVVNVDWGESFSANRGSGLEPGKLKIKSGLVQLEFFSGATMVLEGPAEIEVKSAMEVVCLSGKMHVKVPETAQGFIVDTGQMKVHDLGTEFAIDMTGNKREVHVLDGEVEIHREGKNLKSLLKNDSVAWREGEASLKDIETRADDFVTYRQIDQYDSGYTKKRQDQWRQHMTDLAQREDVILLYDFDVDQEWERSLDNKSTSGGMEGGIVGASWSEGRWQGKKALEFKSINDRVRLHIPGKHKAMTMTCWVRIDSFDRWLSSLLLTDFYKKGALHWQLSDVGEMILGAKFSNEVGSYETSAYNVFTPQVISPDSLGSWMNLAMVYDPGAKEIKQYINGNLIHTGKLKVPQLIQLGNAEIGNWNGGRGHRDAIRSFNGRMDEFIIFSSALSDSEIEKLYKKGRP